LAGRALDRAPRLSIVLRSSVQARSLHILPIKRAPPDAVRRKTIALAAPPPQPGVVDAGDQYAAYYILLYDAASNPPQPTRGAGDTMAEWRADFERGRAAVTRAVAEALPDGGVTPIVAVCACAYHALSPPGTKGNPAAAFSRELDSTTAIGGVHATSTFAHHGALVVWLLLHAGQPWWKAAAAARAVHRAAGARGPWGRLGPLRLEREWQTFAHKEGRDLLGFIDGGANPKTAEERTAAALDARNGSWLLFQSWHHNLDAFARLPVARREAAFGTRERDGSEIADAPPTAHRMCTDQEAPELAPVYRRSMPYMDSVRHAGLAFLLLTRDPAVPARMLNRMSHTGDAMLPFTKLESSLLLYVPPGAALA